MTCKKMQRLASTEIDDDNVIASRRHLPKDKKSLNTM